MIRKKSSYFPENVPMNTPILKYYKNREMLYRVLYWIAAGGYATRPDIALSMGMNMQISTIKKAGLLSIARACNTLEKENLICQTQSRLWHATISLLRLTHTGRAYCQENFPWKVHYTDWDKLIQFHNGLKWINHATTVLVFAYQARLRGWTVEVLPYEADLNTQPDVRIIKDQKQTFVEVEMKASHAKSKLEKWQKQEQIQENVALCMLSTQGAANIAQYFKKHTFYRYQIASVQHLILTAYQEGGPGKLWSFLSEE